MYGPDEIMAGKVCEIIKVVYVIDFDLIVFTLLKMILYIETLDPNRVQVIHDDFCHTDSVPLVTRLPVKYNHSISSCESIHVWKVFTSKR